jgi:hypothetical protein
MGERGVYCECGAVEFTVEQFQAMKRIVVMKAADHWAAGGCRLWCRRTLASLVLAMAEVLQVEGWRPQP